PASAEAIAKKLKLSNREADKLIALASVPEKLKGKLDPVPYHRALYAFGVDAARDSALLLAAENPANDIEAALGAAMAWEGPTFRVQGSDLLELGMAAGPKVGALLRELEEWWIAQDFRPTRKECLTELKGRL